MLSKGAADFEGPLPPKLDIPHEVVQLFRTHQYETVADEDDIGRYLAELQSEQYGRPLSELEEANERSRYVRTRLCHRKLLILRSVSDFANMFVRNLAEAGVLEYLGHRAALPALKRAAWPSDWISFGPVCPPMPSPLSIHDFERAVGGPHVLGAKLVWWCAAAKTPRSFGFDAGLSLEVWSLPIWAVDCGLQAKLSVYPLDLMQECAADLLRIASLGPAANTPVIDEPADGQADGPGEGCIFRWQGKNCTLSDTLSNFVRYLWKQPERLAPVVFANRDVWGGTVKTSAIYTAGHRVNKEFKTNNIPWRVGFDKPNVGLVQDISLRAWRTRRRLQNMKAECNHHLT